MTQQLILVRRLLQARRCPEYEFNIHSMLVAIIGMLVAIIGAVIVLLICRIRARATS